jgi:phosphotransferase system  glucose/maltose/N-acetylglucosamine-specific IIC component
MSYRTLRRRLSEATAAHDWLEGVSTALGLLFLVVAALCVWGIVVAIATLGDDDPAFKTTPGFLQAARGFGIVFFSFFALVAVAVGWFFAGDWVRRVWRRVRGRF